MSKESVFEIDVYILDSKQDSLKTYILKGRAYRDVRVGDRLSINLNNHDKTLQVVIKNINSYRTDLDFLDAGLTAELTAVGEIDIMLSKEISSEAAFDVYEYTFLDSLKFFKIKGKALTEVKIGETLIVNLLNQDEPLKLIIKRIIIDDKDTDAISSGMLGELVVVGRLYEVALCRED